mmetsp:Transcript_17802/g.44153  ORF Transcript_17802/g.44153 Transcript_17802/m.44153 type:complete len:95 (-) Transcript_17802:282-566(-)|eukprot:CAMPEP_0113903638 /NCGR_PEP_ID=MMETSP0780_2-20120614/22684_1 /TAXON_ID=652834 /ORGANISM="Palpitomonas bilix" /LENGTH=94 /DNA_ID=CAMNT_0000896911 /DNA_START=67 /DNA_END=351 /DNA_ORIENTATION=+ /assembly_acc=CAM_ASM_000599
MAKGSMSQASTNAGNSAAAPSRGNAVGLRNRQSAAPVGRRTNRRGASSSSGGGFMNYTTDDAPGIKIGPTTVIVMSLIFLGLVILLHIWGKLRR